MVCFLACSVNQNRSKLPKPRLLQRLSTSSSFLKNVWRIREDPGSSCLSDYIMQELMNPWFCLVYRLPVQANTLLCTQQLISAKARRSPEQHPMLFRAASGGSAFCLRSGPLVLGSFSFIISILVLNEPSLTPLCLFLGQWTGAPVLAGQWVRSLSRSCPRTYLHDQVQVGHLQGKFSHQFAFGWLLCCSFC